MSLEEITGINDDESKSGVVDSELSALQLEYFRRFHLDIQIAYLRHYSGQQRSLFRGSIRNQALLIGFAASIAAATTKFGNLSASLGLFGVLIPVLINMQAGFRQLYKNKENTSRANQTLHRLVKWESKLDKVRAAVKAGNRRPLEAFVRGVNQEILIDVRSRGSQ